MEMGYDMLPYIAPEGGESTGMRPRARPSSVSEPGVLSLTERARTRALLRYSIGAQSHRPRF